MQLFAHVGITLGSAWILEKTVRLIKRNISEPKPNYIATGNLGNHTLEVVPGPVSTTGWLDYRFLLLGSLLPDIIDKPLGIIFLGNGRAFCHTLFFTVLILAAGTYLFLFRKRTGLFCIALGCVAHVLLDSMWLNQSTFFWPLFGWSFPHNNVSVGPWLERTFHNLLTDPSYYIPEAIGVIALVFLYFNLTRNSKISRSIKSKLSVLYQSLFIGRKQRPVSSSLTLSKGATVSVRRSISLMKRPVE